MPKYLKISGGNIGGYQIDNGTRLPPKINRFLLKSEVFKYDMPLDLNMVFIISGLIKMQATYVQIFSHGGNTVISVPDIFKQNIIDSFRGFEFIHSYISCIKTGTNLK